MTRVRGWYSRHKAPALILAGILTALILGAAYVGVAKATDQPSFCRAACHEMEPYHAAWSQGPHKDVSCVACHVDPGPVAGLKHKVVALKEVGAHITGDTSFPRAGLADVPDERCTSCHESISADTTGFDHATHAGSGPCIQCHATTGHTVSAASLKAAGVYSGDTSQGASADASTTAVVDGGKANLSGHKPVACSRCHVMAQTACSACHKPKHVARGACATCHETGGEFEFTHPTDRTDCQTCHKTSATHTTIKAECVECHQEAGEAWTFGHPGQASDCESCHARPVNHRAGNCSSCHAAGTTWAFRHPGSGASCTSCHSRPSGHRSGSCTSCHSTGRSWAFRHPVSSSCNSCHRAPSGHYGSSCSSCHSPGKAWRSATFSHARIPGGEHTYRSFACVNCHPNGKSTHTCAKCHDSSSGPRDD